MGRFLRGVVGVLVTAGLVTAVTGCGNSGAGRPLASRAGTATDSSSQGASSETSSAQGGDILFTRSGHIWRANPDGSNEVQLTNDAGADYAPVWAPDRKHFAYLHVSNPDSLDLDLPKTLVVAPVIGGPGRSFEFDWGLYCACFSPDGTQVAVVGSVLSPLEDSEEWQREPIVLLEIDSGRQTQVYELDDLFATGFNVSWAPDGSSLLLSEAMQDAEDQRMGILELGTRELRWLSTADAADAHWSSDGKSILVTQSPQMFTAIVVTDAAGKTLTEVVRGGGWGDDVDDAMIYGARFSPDDSRIVYCQTPGGEGDVFSGWTARTDGSDHRMIIEDAENPAWSAR